MPRPATCPRRSTWTRSSATGARSGCARTPATPFFAWVSFNSPHDPYDPPAELADLYHDAPIPSRSARSRICKPSPADQRKAFNGTLSNPLFQVDYSSLTPEQIRRIRAYYYAEITHVDRQVGKLLAALEEAGVLDETLIIFSSDHGDALGDHGLIFKNYFYESMVRVPLLARGPA